MQNGSLRRTAILFLCGLIPIFVITALEAGATSLADIYKTGKITLKPAIVVNDSSLPDGLLLVRVGSISIDSFGNIYLLDIGDSNIKKFDSTGKFIKIIGRKGQGPGDFNSPVSFDVGKDRVYVWDMGNRRLSVVSLEGEFIQNRDISGLSGRPRKLRALPNGDIVVETEKTYFEDPSPSQDVFLEVLSPDLKTKGVIYSQQVWRKYIRSEATGLINIPQPFSPDIAWDVAPRGQIIIGFSAKYEFGVYDEQGKLLLSVSHPYRPVKVEEEDKKSFFDNMAFSDGKSIRRGAPDIIVKNTEFPKYKPAYDLIQVDGEGNILVFPLTEGQAKRAFIFDAFSAEGKFIGRVEIVEPKISLRDRVTKWHGKAVWVRQFDPEGKSSIIQFLVESR